MMRNKLIHNLKQTLLLLVIGGGIALSPLLVKHTVMGMQFDGNALEAIVPLNITEIATDSLTVQKPEGYQEPVEIKENDRNCRYVSTEIKHPLMPQQMSIPSQGINMSVVFVPLVNGTWEVKNYYANFAEGTSLVNGKSGNTGLFGHDRVGQFRAIKNMRAGDSISLYSRNYRATYSASNGKNVQPNDVTVFYPTAEPTLTLVTCNGASSEIRYALHANYVRLERLVCD